MSVTLINSTVILNEILALFRTKSTAIQAVNRQYDKRFGNVDLKPGTTLYARKPIQYTVTTGKTLAVQDTVEESVAISCTDQIHIGMPAFTSEQLTMNVDDFSERYLKPAASRLAAEVDKLILKFAAINFWQAVGACGTTPATATVMLQAGQKLTEMNVPDAMEDRYAIIQPAANTALVNALTGLYNPQREIGGQYKSGIMESSMGLKIGVSNNIHRITMGTRDAAGAVTDAAIAEGCSDLLVDSLGSGATMKAGEKFTIADVYAVSPETKINTAALQQFTVTADWTADTTNPTILYFAPAIRATGARQNVNALPVTTAVLTPLGTTASTAYPHNIVMHKDALALVTADLPLPKGVHDAKRTTLDGISLRFLTDYNGITDEFFSRLDLFYGISLLRGESGVVLFG